MNGEDYVRAKKILNVHKRLMSVQMNQRKLEKDVYDKLVLELEQELTELKNEGEN